MAVGHLFASLILLLISNTGSSAEDTVYVETGAGVQLDIQRDKLPAEFDELFWEKDKSNTLVKYYNGFKQVKHFKFYEGRVYFNNKTFCVILKNMQKNDSGVYTAMITGDKNGDIAAHTVSVIDKVEAPLLTIIPYQLSSDSCTGNITCKGHNLTITSTYYNGSCSPGKGTSHEKYTIILICSGKNIICNNSNPVSWEKYETNITRLCEDRDDPKKHEAHTNHLNLVIGCVVGGVVTLAGFALVAHCCWKRYKGGQQDFNTVYEGVGDHPMETIKTESHTYDVPDRTPAQSQEKKESSTIYHMVGQPPNQPVTAVTEHTIYSQVCKQPPAKRPDTTSSNNTRNPTEDCG